MPALRVRVKDSLFGGLSEPLLGISLLLPASPCISLYLPAA